MKVLAIHNILWSHYKARIFRGVHKAVTESGGSFFVLQMAYSERSRLALKADLSIHDYPYEVLFPDKAIEEIGAADKVKKLIGAVKNYKPDIIYLNGYYDVSYWFVLAYCRINNIRVVVDFESNEISRNRVWWKERLKSIFLSQCDALVCLGQKAADYAIKLNVKPEKILSKKNVGVDNDALLNIFQKELPYREQRKRQLGLPAYNFIYAGRFVERKNLVRLIKAFHKAQQIADSGKDWGIILSGEGEMKKELAQLASDLGNSSVHFMEPCEWYEVPVRYTISDVAVLPSTFEPFGFLTNEAMVYSMPVIVSERCGSAADLVINDYNGFQFNPFDEEDLKEKFIMIMSNPARFKELGANGKRIIDQWAPDIVVNELVQSFLKVNMNG